MRISYKRKELLNEIANIAYVLADVEQDTMPAHTLHQTFDVCEEENVARVYSLLALAYAEVTAVLAPVILPLPVSIIYKYVEKMDSYHLRIKDGRLSTSSLLRIKETVREYMIARALAGWLAVTLPGKADYWTLRGDSLKSLLAGYASSAGSFNVKRRRVAPI